MKKVLLKPLCVLLCLCFTLPLTGCGSPRESYIVTRMLEAVLDEDSFSCYLDIYAQADVGSLTLNASAEGTGSLTLSAPEAEAELTVSMDRLETQVNVEIKKSPEGLDVSLEVPAASRVLPGLKWTVPVNVSGEKDRDFLFAGAAILVTSGMVKVSPAEEHNGGSVIPVTVTVPGDLLSGLISAESVPDEMTVELMLDSESYLPVKISADLAPIAKAAVAKELPEAARGVELQMLQVTATVMDG